MTDVVPIDDVVFSMADTVLIKSYFLLQQLI